MGIGPSTVCVVNYSVDCVLLFESNFVPSACFSPFFPPENCIVLSPFSLPSTLDYISLAESISSVCEVLPLHLLSVSVCFFRLLSFPLPAFPCRMSELLQTNQASSLGTALGLSAAVTHQLKSKLQTSSEGLPHERRKINRSVHI